MDSEKQFIICPACNGSGKQKFGLACPECSGRGVGLSERGHFFYWGLRLGQVTIGLGYVREKIDRLINFAAIMIGLVGLAAFGWWFFDNAEYALMPENLPFWFEQHPLLLIFWIGVLAWMFVYYRVSEEPILKPKIAKLKADEPPLPVAGWDEAIHHLKGKSQVDVVKGYSLKAIETIEAAYSLARQYDHAEVTVLHLFDSLAHDENVGAIFSRLNIDANRLAKKFKNQLSMLPKSQGNALSLSKEVRQVLIEGYLEAHDLGQLRVKPFNLLVASLRHNNVVEEILYEQEIDNDKLSNTVQWFRINERLIEAYKEYRHMARFKPSSNMDKAYTSVATPFLNNFARDLTLAAKWFKLEFCVSREKEMEEIFAAFESGKNGVLLVGDLGVGKNAIVHGLAQLMVKEQVPKYLQDKRLLELDISRLISGANPAEAQERLLTCLDEITRAGNIILYINNIETISGITSGGEQSLDLTDVLVGAIQQHRLFCLATVTKENYLRAVEGRPIGNSFGKVTVAEPGHNQAIIMLESKVGYLEGGYKVYFTYSALDEAVNLTSKYVHDRFLPAKAIDVLEAVAVKVSKSKGDRIITRETVDLHMSEITGIPLTKVGMNEGKELMTLENRIHEHMIDQVEAVDMVAASLRRARAQLNEGKRPIANFLFLGPTGVGKTELAKTVAKVYFGNEKYMIRLDMSEYQAQDSIVKMIGDQTTKGYLTEAVRQSPFSILLLDEFEKAHPDILNLFLQVMDDGRLTDGQGHTIDFTNCILIATSNAGALYIQEQIRKGTPVEQIKEVLINDQLNKIMRPELINRFDGVIVFKPLSQNDVVEITRLLLRKIEKNLKDKGIRMRMDEQGIALLAQAGFDPKFGARPLRRLLQDRVENVIANKILSSEVKRRDTIVIDDQGEVSVEAAPKI